MYNMTRVKECTKCKLLKLISEFGTCIDKNTKRYPRSKCKLCSCIEQKERSKNDPDFSKKKHARKRARAILNPIKSFVTERIATYRKQTEGSDLTTKFLIDKFHEQSGSCYFTNKPLHISITDGEGYHSGSLSLDKLNPNFGYNQSNVVWCSFQVNTSKGRRTEEEFYDFCRTVLHFSGVRADRK